MAGVNVDELLSRSQIRGDKSRKIMHYFIDHPQPLSRKEICKKFELPWTTAYDSLKPLFESGFLKRFERANPVGRCTIMYKLNGDIFS